MGHDCHGTLTTDANNVETSTQTTRTKEVTTTKDPKEAAREAALELSKKIFSNITKHLRESIASKDFSVFTTANDNQDEKDELHPFRHQPKHHHEHHWGPYFDEPEGDSGILYVRAHLASEALLNCRVGMLRDKTVMWLKRTADKVQILLTVGLTTYSGDTRIAVKFQYPNNWRLSINPVQKEDAGLYMCQISTHPPRVLLTNVTVLAPILKIVDEQGHEVRDRYYKAGSSIELSCRVSRAFTGSLTTSSPSNTPPSILKQLLANQMTTTAIPATTTTLPTVVNATVASNFTSTVNATGVVTATESSKRLNATKAVDEKIVENNNVFGITWHKDGKVITHKVISRNMSSTFKLSHAEQKDSGAYSCSIQNTSTVLVQVQVLSGWGDSGRSTPRYVESGVPKREVAFNAALSHRFIVIASDKRQRKLGVLRNNII
ncbi:defective proboscis extension response 18 [Arctopsyche grandis]|uniref:defective proboscis extension response 18 n=1 Tax=Arctopsyche grandis TaxID=121162 RepID=UPI00406D9E71